ncbi:TadE family type IV pilus minor pilin [Janibacter alittae]|uniref:TadE family type IV pilus minor pilin n=1 Tax=Janibacter alittae TaxID=3115209 RepID=A0ABZ2MFP1_9MICO
MVTAELALTIPAVIVVLVTCLSALAWGVDQVRCVDAARVAVRELARGESTARSVRDAQQTAPESATVEVSRPGADVTVAVTAPAPVGLAWVGQETRCSSTARRESPDDAP